MFQKRTIEQDMPVRGTDLKVRVERGFPFFGADKLVITDDLDKRVRDIISLTKGRIEGIYPMNFDEGRFVVGSHDNPGVIKVDSDRLGVCESVEYDVSNGELVSRYRVNM